MDFVFACLASVQIAFILGFFLTIFFFRIRQALFHQIIIASIISIAYGVEVVLKVISDEPFGLAMICGIIWVTNAFSAVSRFKRVKRFEEQKQKENQNQLR